ncbi:response regulator transcription factor, partial [Corallococcus exiguus]|uniref:response regulator transcription factor n=1 Tax=Corallococcus exiguus TaxID=83462 RepID=UPI001474B329
LTALRRVSHMSISAEVDELTERERDILLLICRGQSDLEMGTTLNLSRNTIRNHVSSLYRKIGVNRRGAAIIWARERGISGQDSIPSKVRRHAPNKRQFRKKGRKY